MLVTSSPSSASVNIVRESVRQRLCVDEKWELEQRWAALVGRQSELPLDRPGVGEEENGHRIDWRLQHFGIVQLAGWWI